MRRQLASTFTIGLLGFLTPDTLPAGLEVTAKLPAAGQTLMLAVVDDPWNRWTFSLNGFMNVDSEQSTFESEWGGAAGRQSNHAGMETDVRRRDSTNHVNGSISKRRTRKKGCRRSPWCARKNARTGSSSRA